MIPPIVVQPQSNSRHGLLTKGLRMCLHCFQRSAAITTNGPEFQLFVRTLRKKSIKLSFNAQCLIQHIFSLNHSRNIFHQWVIYLYGQDLEPSQPDTFFENLLPNFMCRRFERKYRTSLRLNKLPRYEYRANGHPMDQPKIFTHSVAFSHWQKYRKSSCRM